MFLDASVLVAILLREDGFEHILARIEGYQGKIYTSPLARFETVVSISRAIAAGKGMGRPTREVITEIDTIVDGLLDRIQANEASVSSGIGKLAIEAAATYGKTVGHPADLNFGDCFSYACAKAYRLTLIYKGDDFAKTDLR